MFYILGHSGTDKCLLTLSCCNQDDKKVWQLVETPPTAQQKTWSWKEKFGTQKAPNTKNLNLYQTISACCEPAKAEQTFSTEKATLC